MVYYINVIWSKYCFYIEEQRLINEDNIKEPLEYTEFINQKVTTLFLNIFKSGTFSIINLYFQDLLRIFTNIRIKHIFENININEFKKK